MHIRQKISKNKWSICQHALFQDFEGIFSYILPEAVGSKWNYILSVCNQICNKEYPAGWSSLRSPMESKCEYSAVTVEILTLR